MSGPGVCSPCPSGYYSNSTGRTSCIACRSSCPSWTERVTESCQATADLGCEEWKQDMTVVAKMWMLIGTPLVAACFVYLWVMFGPDCLVGRRQAALPRPFFRVSPIPGGVGVYFDDSLGEWVKIAPSTKSSGGKEHSTRPSWLLLMGSSADWAMNLQVVLIVHPAAPLAIFWVALASVVAPLVLAAVTSARMRRTRHMWLFVLGCERWSDAGNKLSNRAEALLSAVVLAARCVPSLYAQAAFLSVQATMPPSASHLEPTLDTAIVGLALALSLAATARRLGALFAGVASRHDYVPAGTAEIRSVVQPFALFKAAAARQNGFFPVCLSGSGCSQ